MYGNTFKLFKKIIKNIVENKNGRIDLKKQHWRKKV